MSWKQFLEKRHQYAEGTHIRLCDWAETLVRDVLLPQVHEKQYTLSVSPRDYVACLLNTLYRSLHPRNYICAHRRTFVWTPEQYEYFNEQFPPALWKKIRDEFQLEILTDKVWSDLEYFVFSHIDFEKSHANTLMEDQYKGIEDFEDEELIE